MVRIATFISAVALFSTLASGAPSLRRRQDDSAIGDQVGVSAPDGIPVTNAGELASQRAREAGQTVAAPVMTQPSYKEAAEPAKVEHQSAPMHVTTESSSAAHTPVHTPSSSAQHTPSSSAAHTPVHTPSSSAQHTPAHPTTTVVHKEAPKETALSTSAPLPTHGSGSSNWGNPQYNDCVQQCIATHGAPGSQYKPTATAATSSAGSTGTGATHTVIVAPTQGVLRYVPFAVNATVGDTIKFMWGANNHTVTKSSSLLPCNRTADAFASGIQNKDFVFTQVVNDTKPTYFFCAAPSHCAKGMFGIVNPTVNFGAVTSVGQQLQDIAANNSAVQGYAAYTAKETQLNANAARWGSNLDLEAFPDWARASVAENVLFTRNFLAKNPETLKEDGSIDLSSASSTPLVIPQDIAAALASAPATDAPANTPVVPAETPAAPAAEETPDNGTGNAANLGADNGALSGSAPRALVAAMAVLATFALL